MKSKFCTVISCIIAVFLLTFNVSAEYASEIYEYILNYKLTECGAETVQEWIDTELAESAGITSEWYAITLSQCGEYDFSTYKSALENYLQNNKINSAVSRQKYALALIAAGGSPYIADTMENSIGEQGIMSYVYGLHLLSNGCTSTQYTAESVIAEIISMQFEDGGWAVMGEYGDPDVTAMTIQALAPYYSTDETVTKAVDEALQFLSDKQLADGGYKSMGKETAESVSQVIIALSSLGIDADTDSHFSKNGNTLFTALEKFRLDDGSFCHEIGSGANHTATAQAFMAAAAYEKMKDGANLFAFENKTEETEMTSETTANETEITEKKSETAAENAAEKSEKRSYKPIVCVVVIGIAAAVCIVLWTAKRRNKKNFLAIAFVAAIAVIIVLCTDFQSSDEYYGTNSAKANPIGTVTLEIRCDTVAGRKDYIPENGVILAETEYEFEADETVYDILVEACRENEIQTEFSGGYVSGMSYIYEFDFGDLSGWMYFVNGEEASVGCDSRKLADGDRIEWLYSCEMGNDLK